MSEKTLYINTKRYTMKMHNWHNYGLYVDDTCLAEGSRSAIKKEMERHNSIYLFAMAEACGQMGCKPEFIEGEDQ